MSWYCGAFAAIALACFGVASMAAQAAMGAPSATPDSETGR